MSDLKKKVTDMHIALEFYASKQHFSLDKESSWDSCSGEPHNWLYSGVDDSFIEDGSVAAIALDGGCLWQLLEDAPLEDGVHLLLLIDGLAVECMYDSGDEMWYYVHSDFEGERVTGCITHFTWPLTKPELL